MDNLPHSTTDKQPHAGNLPPEIREVPVETFDMPLEDAVEANKLSPLPVEEAAEPTYPKLTESEQLNSTKPNRSRKGFIAGVAVGASVAVAGAALAIGLNLPKGDNANENEPPVNDPKATSEAEAPAIPPEAQEFVDAYGSRYDDPVATYYAETAYRQANDDKLVVISQSYIDDYNYESRIFDTGELSPLGFPVLRFSPDKEVNLENAVEQFNDALPALNQLINLLAKNPTIPEVAVIKDEFVKYSGFNNDTDAGHLVDMLHEVTIKYGSAANYIIEEGAITDGSSNTESAFRYGSPVIDAVDENNKITDFSTNLDLLIDITQFDNNGNSTNTTETIVDAQIGVRASGFDPQNVGYIGIGAKANH